MERIDDDNDRSDCSYTTTLLLAFVFGILGIHHFYVGRKEIGIIDLAMSIIGFTLIQTGYEILGVLLLALDYIHSIYYIFLLIIGKYRDGDGKIIAFPGQKS